MHGLINRAIQVFLSVSYGENAWNRIVEAADLAEDLDEGNFETMRLYDDTLTMRIIESATLVLERQRASLLEDLGTFIVCNKEHDAIRRLLRFGGVSFTDFLYSLDDLQGRSRLAVDDLDLPELSIDEFEPGRFNLTCRGGVDGFGDVLVGLLRSLADDYGALAVLEREASPAGSAVEIIKIDVHDPAYHAGRQFDLTKEVA